MTDPSTWATPFSHSEYASVFFINEPAGEGTALVVVAPGGPNAYPKYLVRFSEVFAFTCEEEAGTALDVGQSETPQDSWAYIWPASPYAAAQGNTALAGDLDLRHYVIVGGDNIVSVVSAGPPTVDVLDGPTALAVEYAV